MVQVQEPTVGIRHGDEVGRCFQDRREADARLVQPAAARPALCPELRSPGPVRRCVPGPFSPTPVPWRGTAPLSRQALTRMPRAIATSGNPPRGPYSANEGTWLPLVRMLAHDRSRADMIGIEPQRHARLYSFRFHPQEGIHLPRERNFGLSIECGRSLELDQALDGGGELAAALVPCDRPEGRRIVCEVGA